jgi:hypothetical protein
MENKEIKKKHRNMVTKQTQTLEVVEPVLPLQKIDLNKRAMSSTLNIDKKSRNAKKLTLTTGKFSFKSPKVVANSRDARK